MRHRVPPHDWIETRGTQAEGVDEIVQFGEEEGFGPESRVAVFLGQLRRVAFVELVLEDNNGNGVVSCEIGEREKVFVVEGGFAINVLDRGKCQLL